MKMKQEHYDYIKNAIEQANTGDIEQEYKNGTISPMRYRWDLTYAASLSGWICKNLYSYLDDTHIDTALRNITNTK